jgi:hypothetical protein
MTHMRVKLQQPYMGHRAGSVLEVARRVGERLVRDGHAVEIRPKAMKIKTPDSIKGSD